MVDGFGVDGPDVVVGVEEEVVDGAEGLGRSRSAASPPLHVVTLREDSELEGQLGSADPADFPRMSRVFGDGREQSRGTIFDTALEVVLDGIEQRFAAP